MYTKPSRFGTDDTRLNKRVGETKMKAYLSPTFNNQKSFYGKAEFEREESGRKVLYSYNTKVAVIEPNDELTVFGTYSQTTMKHIKEFINQHYLLYDIDMFTKNGMFYVFLEHKETKKKICERV